MTLVHDAVVRPVEVLYLIFKFVIALWQSFDNDIHSARQFLRRRGHRKQELADLEFVLGHKAPQTAAPEIKHHNRVRF